MKRKMNSWLKRSLAWLLCMSLMVFYMLPVSAATEHAHEFFLYAEERSVLSFNEYSHTIVIRQKYVCGWSGCDEKYIPDPYNITEVHDIVYTDLGEVNGMHRYRVECKVCGFHYEL